MGRHFLLSKGEDSEVSEHSAQRANMPGSGSTHLLTPFEELFSVRFSFRMCRSTSPVYKPISFHRAYHPAVVTSLFIVATIVIVNKVKTSM
ncbi:hypothetical protein GQ457_16G021720 [Hibiscus cannabinus]